ncbi:MAG: hypothetical protein GX594_08425 [Pirellulaceae bacterium]|nr:hypothetical protein [Pirellulaceae bacterium]
MNENTFAQLVLDRATKGNHFRPQAYYDPDGDCIEFLAKNEPFYGERIDSLVTVYYSEKNHEVIGSLIKGVSSFIAEMTKKAPGFRIEVQDGRVRLEHIFTARLWHSDQPPRDEVILTYQKLRDVAEKTEAEAALC